MIHKFGIDATLTEGSVNTYDEKPGLTDGRSASSHDIQK
jgi:hypothetical protein